MLSASSPRSVGIRQASLAWVKRAVREFLAGFALLGRGLRLLARRPGLFGLGAIPPAITSLLFIAVLAVVFTQLDPMTTWLTPFADSWSPEIRVLIRVLVGTALVSGLVLVMVVTFTTLTLTIGSPIYDKLSEAVEREFGPVPELAEPLATGAARGLRHSVTMIAVSVLVTLPLFAAGFVPGLGQTVVPVVSAAFGGWMLGIELVGPSLRAPPPADPDRPAGGDAATPGPGAGAHHPHVPDAGHPAGRRGGLPRSHGGRNLAGAAAARRADLTGRGWPVSASTRPL